MTWNAYTTPKTWNTAVAPANGARGMGACNSLLNAQVELIALKQLREQSAANNEKIAQKNEKHSAEMAELRRELGQAKDDRVREMQELTMKHQQELRRLQQEPMFFLTPI